MAGRQVKHFHLGRAPTSRVKGVLFAGRGSTPGAIAELRVVLAVRVHNHMGTQRFLYVVLCFGCCRLCCLDFKGSFSIGQP